MRIIYAAPAYKPAWRVGGPVRSVSAAAESLVKRGHEVFVFTTNSNLDSDLDVPTDRFVDVQGVQVRYFARSEPLKKLFPRIDYISKSLGFLYCRGMWAELDRLVPTVDIVHTHLPFCYPTYAAARLAFRHQVPLFYSQRGVLDPEHLRFRSLKKKAYLSLVELPILRRAAGLIALTEGELLSYRSLGLRSDCYIVPNGVEASQFEARDVCNLGALGITEKDQVVLFLGRVHPFKGVDRLLDAFAAISRQRPRAKLVIAGPDEFGLEMQFRQGVEEGGLKSRVIFAGMVEGERKRDLLMRADLFVLPSKGEGFSMAVLEALAASTAVLLSVACNFPEVERAGAGRIVEVTVQSLASAMSEMLEEPSVLKQMGESARSLVLSHYTWDSVVSKLLDAYSRGIANHSARY